MAQSLAFSSSTQNSELYRVDVPVLLEFTGSDNQSTLMFLILNKKAHAIIRHQNRLDLLPADVRVDKYITCLRSLSSVFLLNTSLCNIRISSRIAKK